MGILTDEQRTAQVHRKRISETLRPDLEAALNVRDHLEVQLRDYEDLKGNLETIAQSGSKQLRTRVDVGGDAKLQAHVPDTSTVLVKTGLGFWAEVSLAEAPAAIAVQQAELHRRLALASSRIATIRTHLKLTLHAVDALAGDADRGSTD